VLRMEGVKLRAMRPLADELRMEGVKLRAM
jgi:hypothetical protein